MSGYNLYGNRKSTLRIDGRMQLIANHLTLLPNVSSLTPQLALPVSSLFRIGFFLVGVNGCAVDCDMNSDHDYCFLSLRDKILKQLHGKFFASRSANTA